MPFTISVKRAGKPETIIPLEVGGQLFVLGANGSGKSSLMHDFYRANSRSAIRVSAHRQSWFSSGDVVSPQELRQFLSKLPGWDSDHRARWHDMIPEQRPRMAITQLVDAENVRARAIASAVDDNRLDEATRLAETPSAIKTINDLLRLANLAIAISIRDGDQVVASKSGGPHFSVAELSDGERNALVIAATVLTAPPSTLILIDEPERHLHRSIISPLLTELFAKRPDCAFVVSTHEVMLPIDHFNSQVLLVRGCTYNGSTPSEYDVDLLPPQSAIDDDLKRDIFGARKKILFVEGAGQSLDKALYSVLFSTASVIPKRTCRDVEHAVRAIRDANELHWIQAFGIIDGDGRSQAQLEGLQQLGIYAVPAYSAESIYYHVDVQKRAAERLARSIGGDVTQRLRDVKQQVVRVVSQDCDRLSQRIAEKEIRERVVAQLPKQHEISSKSTIEFRIDAGSIVAAEVARLRKYIEEGDVASIVRRYPIREAGALDQIARGLGFQNRKQYESSVINMLQCDPECLAFVQSLFGNLASDLLAG